MVAWLTAKFYCSFYTEEVCLVFLEVLILFKDLKGTILFTIQG